MSLSQEAATIQPASSDTAATGTFEQELQTFLAAIRSDDGEGTIAALNGLFQLGGATGVATIGAELNASGLTDAMLAVLSKRAESLRTVEAWLQLSDAAFAAGRAPLVVEAAGRALQIEPGSSMAALIVSDAANRREDFDEAFRVISELVARVPAEKDNPSFIIQTAAAEIGRSHGETALSIVDAALPRLTAAGLEFDALVLRARAVSALAGRGGDAVDAWERAMAVARNPAEVDYTRGSLMATLRKEKRFDEALAQLDLALEAVTDAKERAPLIGIRVSLMAEKGDIDGALAELDALLTATTAPEGRVTFRLQQASIAANAGRWKDAATRFDAALSEVPKDAANTDDQRHAIQMQKAQTLATHEIDLVWADLDELDTATPADQWPLAIDVRVSGLIAAERPDDALKWLAARVARTPALGDHPAVHQLRAEIEMKRGDAEAAMVECRRAVDLAATATDPRGLGAVLMSAYGSQQWQAAIDAYDRLVNLDSKSPVDPSARTITAVAYLRKNRPKDALRLTDEAVPMPPLMLVLREVARGEAQVLLEQYDNALTTTAEGLKRYEAASGDSSSPPLPPEFRLTLHTLRAQAFNGKEKFEEARQEASAAIDEQDDTGAIVPGLTALVRVGAYMQRSLALYRLGRTKDAQRDIDAAIDRFEQLQNSPAVAMMKQGTDFKEFEGSLWYAKGVVLKFLDRSEEALAAYTRAAKVEKHGAAAAIERGRALSKTGDFSEATFAFCTALTRASSPKERAEALAGKGRAMVSLKQYEKAIATLQSALDANLTSQNDDPDIFEQLGIAYSSLQRHQAAKRAFYRAWTLTMEKEEKEENEKKKKNEKKDTKSRANLVRGMTAADLRQGEPQDALDFLKYLEVKKFPSELTNDRALLFNRALALDALGRRKEAIPFLMRARDKGLDRAQRELDRLDAPAGLSRWTNYWFGPQADRKRRAFGTAFAFIAAIGLSAPLLHWWLNGKLEWYLLLLPSVVALLLLALPNMKSIGFEGGGLSVSVEPLSATGRDAAEVPAPETYATPTVAALPVTTERS